MRIITLFLTFAAVGMPLDGPSAVAAQQVPPPVATQNIASPSDPGVHLDILVGGGSIGLAGGLVLSAAVGNGLDIVVRATETSEFTLF